jgi:hypothetical protein
MTNAIEKARGDGANWAKRNYSNADPASLIREMQRSESKAEKAEKHSYDRRYQEGARDELSYMLNERIRGS